MRVEVIGGPAKASAETARPRASVEVIEPSTGVQYALAAADVAYISLRSMASWAAMLPSVDYELATASAFIDDRSLHKYVPEIVVATDGSAFLLAKGFQDSVQATHTRTVFEFAKDVSEDVYITDAIQRAIVFIRNVEDVVDPLEAIAITAQKLFESQFGLSDSSSLEPLKSLSDRANLSDLVTGAVAKSLADSATPIELLVLSGAKALSDQQAVSDAVQSSIGKGLFEEFGTSDSAVSLSIKALAEQVASTDKATRSSEKVVADTLQTLDVSFRVVAKLLQDAVSMTQLVMIAIQKAIADQTLAQDTSFRVFSKALSSGFALDDTASIGDGLNQGVNKQVNNVVFVSESRAAAFSKALAEAVAAQDSGRLIQQSYCDITYFSGDYVGEVRNF